jgi:hypothetical protein
MEKAVAVAVAEEIAVAGAGTEVVEAPTVAPVAPAKWEGKLVPSADQEIVRAIEIVDKASGLLEGSWTRGSYEGCLVGAVVSASRK